ncbi:nuclear transport factor 2 family protein [Candidatus Foliamicus sp.]
MQDRSAYIDFIERRYFGAVSAGDVKAALRCFAEDAQVIIRHGDQPERRYSPSPGPGQEPLADFFEHLCANYDCWFGDFSHTVDAAHKRAASRFTVRLSPRADGLYGEFPAQTLMNSNFFEFAGERIAFMLIYYANTSDSDSPKPTGYPAP